MGVFESSLANTSTTLVEGTGPIGGRSTRGAVFLITQRNLEGLQKPVRQLLRRADIGPFFDRLPDCLTPSFRMGALAQ